MKQRKLLTSLFLVSSFVYFFIDGMWKYKQ